MPMDRSKYPDNWDLISIRIRKERALDQCECTGQCGLHDGRCNAVNELPHPVTGSKVVLTVAHLDQDTFNNVDSNLLAMCQRCHLTYDRHYYRNQRLAWVKTLSDTDLNVLLAAVESYNTEVLGKVLGVKAKSIFGEDYVDSLDLIATTLQDEWEERNQAPIEADIG